MKKYYMLAMTVDGIEYTSTPCKSAAMVFKLALDWVHWRMQGDAGYQYTDLLAYEVIDGKEEPILHIQGFKVIF